MGTTVSRHGVWKANGEGRCLQGGSVGGGGSRTVTFADEPYVRGLKDMTELFLVRYYSDI